MKNRKDRVATFLRIPGRRFTPTSLKAPILGALGLFGSIAMFPSTAMAVDGGYGPPGGSASGATGTFTNIIVAKTIGAGWGQVQGDYRGTSISLDVAPGTFNRPSEIALSAPGGPLTFPNLGAVICAIAVDTFQGLPLGSPQKFSVTLRNQTFSDKSKVYLLTTGEHWELDGSATARTGQVSFELGGAPAFMVTGQS